jgi:hypothetical protein
VHFSLGSRLRFLQPEILGLVDLEGYPKTLAAEKVPGELV